jgi:hypothetical protein
MGAVPPHDESRVELALALREASAAGAEATLREAVSAVLAAIPDPVARDGARASLALRFVAPGLVAQSG